MQAYWEALEAGNSDEAAARYKATVALAEARGFAYRPAADLVAGDFAALVERVKAAIEATGSRPAAGPDADALLGLVPAPRPRWSGVLADFSELTRDRIEGKAPDQVARWEDPRKLTVDVFQAHGAAADGSVVFRRKLSHAQPVKFFSAQPPCLVAVGAPRALPRRVLEPVERALAGERRQSRALRLQPAEHGGEHRIPAQIVLIDQFPVAERDAEHPLPTSVGSSAPPAPDPGRRRSRRRSGRRARSPDWSRPAAARRRPS